MTHGAAHTAPPPAAAPDVAPWLRHMRRGAWSEAWAESDAVLRARAVLSCRHLPRHEQWVWDGTPPDGRRLLVRCYHGLGDTIQFVRFAPELRRRGAEVTFWAQPALLPLLATAPGVDRLLPLHDGVPDVAYDMDVEVMELAHVVRAAPETVGRHVPYLRADPAPVPRDGRLAVGLAWDCGDWLRERRAVPFPLLAPLAAVEGVRLHVLQRGPGLAQAATHPAFDCAVGSDDVLQTARVMRALDLVISVDTMPAHLAGALGVPVWTLVPHDPDWRWMEGREDSPWYPTMRLFRQPSPGAWEPVIARVAGELARLVRGRRAARGAAPAATLLPPAAP